MNRDRIANELRKFHRNSCYPEATEFEVDAAVTAIIQAQCEHIFARENGQYCETCGLLWSE